MELKIISTDTAVQPIAWNAEEVKQYVTELVAQFNNQLFTDQTIPEAKEARAKLNALSKRLTAWRIEATAPYLAPIETFKTQVNEVKQIIDEASARIDTVVKDFTARKQDEKRDEIDRLYRKNLAIYADLVPLEKIFNPKWLNATYPIKTIEKELFDIAMRINDDLAVISTTYPDSDTQLEIKTEYFKTLNLAVTLAEYNRKKEYRAYLEKLRNEPPQDDDNTATQAETSATNGETAKNEECDEELQKVVLTANEGVFDVPKEKTYEMSFTVTATKQQLVALKYFFEQMKIDYKKI